MKKVGIFPKKFRNYRKLSLLLYKIGLRDFEEITKTFEIRKVFQNENYFEFLGKIVKKGVDFLKNVAYINIQRWNATSIFILKFC